MLPWMEEEAMGRALRLPCLLYVQKAGVLPYLSAHGPVLLCYVVASSWGY